MAPPFSDIVEDARVSLRSLIEYGEGLFNPTVRLGVTGLSRAGKTVFITALVHGLLRGGRFPVFESLATGRIARAYLAPQPDDTVPRFAYESHVRTLLDERRWPKSTVDISELRLIIEYQKENTATRTLTLDLVDYPGEWLLDLPLLNKTYVEWSTESLELSRHGPREKLAKKWHAHLAALDPRFAMSLLPPGRFLMPGNLAGSPALTFAPLDVPLDDSAPDGSLWAMMERRYEAYKDVVVRPFFRDHFSRLDRQIVLVDALAAFNAGPDALNDLEGALSGILNCFNVGRSTLLSSLFRPRIDRILFAATKADHLHRSSHDQLEAVLSRMIELAAAKAEFAGATVDVVALAAVRATREALVKQGRDELPSILGTPEKGETSGGDTFDGETEVATFPGDLPTDLDAMFSADGFRGLSATSAEKSDYRFMKFRPPSIAHEPSVEPALPHIRLDRALQFLIGDKLR